METQRKVPPKGTDARREYDRLKKASSRSRLRAARKAASIPSARDYQVPEAWDEQLSAAAQAAENAIRAELNTVTYSDLHIVIGVSQVLYGLRSGFTQRVSEPTGIRVGDWFVDALGSEAVEYVQRNEALLDSPTFKRMYDDLLRDIVRWSKSVDPIYLTPEFIVDVEAALAKTYVPSGPLEPPKPEPDRGQRPPLASAPQILNDTRIKRLELLESQTLPPEARHYLDGTI